MAAHEFGLMPAPPLPGQRYDTYTPEKYACIRVEDACIESLCPALSGLDFYWHSTDVPAKGLAYTGITLIPPATAARISALLSDHAHPASFRALLETAAGEEKWIIHFGI
ncbi:MAG: hypothetical protein IKL89_06690 [Clostridia bacterium]|nr:hypothetical protein [Clostridia bacterium]